MSVMFMLITTSIAGFLISMTKASTILPCRIMTSSIFDLPAFPVNSKCRFDLKSSEYLLIYCYDRTYCSTSIYNITFLAPKGFRLPACYPHMAGEYSTVVKCGNVTSQLNTTLIVFDRPTAPNITHNSLRTTFECSANSTSLPESLRGNISYSWRINGQRPGKGYINGTEYGEGNEFLYIDPFQDSLNIHGVINVMCIATEDPFGMESVSVFFFEVSPGHMKSTELYSQSSAAPVANSVAKQEDDIYVFYVIAGVMGALVLISLVAVACVIKRSRKPKATVQRNLSTTTITFRNRSEGSLSNMTSATRLTTPQSSFTNRRDTWRMEQSPDGSAASLLTEDYSDVGEDRRLMPASYTIGRSPGARRPLMPRSGSDVVTSSSRVSTPTYYSNHTSLPRCPSGQREVRHASLPRK